MMCSGLFLRGRRGFRRIGQGSPAVDVTVQWNRTADNSLWTYRMQHAAIPMSGYQDIPLSDSLNWAGSPLAPAYLHHTQVLGCAAAGIRFSLVPDRSICLARPMSPGRQVKPLNDGLNTAVYIYHCCLFHHSC